MRIYLYTLITPENQRRPLPRSAWGGCKNRARRAVDWLAWKAAGRFTFDFHAYEDHVHTNEGDIAIRMALREQFSEVLGAEKPEIVDVAWESLDERKAAEIDARGDLLVIAGGYFHYSPEGVIKPPVPPNAGLFEKIGCPIVAYGAGVNCRRGDEVDTGRRLQPESERALRRVLARLSLCAVRDERSAAFLRQYGAADPRVVLDPAMLLHGSVTSREQPGGIDIGLNFGFHGPHSQSILKRNIRDYIEFARAMERAFRCRLHYFVHSEGEELVIRLLRSAGIRLNVVRGRAPELIGHYRAMTIHISYMMHSAILSLAAGTPAIGLAYDIKNTAFFELMQLERYCLDANRVTAAQLAESAGRLLLERESVARAIVRRKAELARRNHAFLESAAALARAHAAARVRPLSAVP
jgi:polysaccharide pyruvyl transferase WcaK-like protein